ncbi:MAG: YbaK/EbsC family protein [Rhizobiaceae bacterium]|nr:YbaK/EbsC family protein [Rhizobiaceae bacterium]MCV0406285.1 YbaK/EbsC family protein [Rhizobiaceae bacterium]
MAGSVDRVTEAAAKAGLTIAIRRMDGSTRTAKEAAAQCGCDVAQIVKSLVFSGTSTGKLYLFLVSGRNQIDLSKAAAQAGESLERADPRTIRDRTGFAIGGVAPIGHKEPVAAFADEALLEFDSVWAAAGAPDAVFEAAPDSLVKAAGAVVMDLKA